MTSDITSALTLLIVGMTSVFLILTIIVLSAKVLIRVVNPMGVVQKVDVKKSKKFPPSIIVIATAVVEEVTQGRGRIEKIEKIS